MPKAIVIVPARDEASRIRVVLESLLGAQADGLIQKILVVDDGSRDGTAKIVREMGIPLLRLKRNRGKSFAFCAGLHAIAAENPDYVITIDADLERFASNKIHNLILPLERNPELPMTVGKIPDGYSYSGQRAIRFSRLKPLFDGRPTWVKYFGVRFPTPHSPPRTTRRRGYGLEMALNIVLTGNADLLVVWSVNPRKKDYEGIIHTQFTEKQKEGHPKLEAWASMQQEIGRVRQLFVQRKNDADLLKTFRKDSTNKEARRKLRLMRKFARRK